MSGITVDRLRIDAGDGVDLEAQWDLPAAIDHVVVFCHPNPLDGGTMRAPLMQAVASGLSMRGVAVLRFNFRGVGDSTGEHGRGIPEVADVAAAVATAVAAYPEHRVAICGWSFGAATALRWQAGSGATLPYVGIAPPIYRNGKLAVPPPETLQPADRHFVIGDRDQFATVADVEGYAQEINATVTVLKGSDHFFYFREDRVVDAVYSRLSVIDPEAPTAPG